MKALYTVLFQLVQRILKELARLVQLRNESVLLFEFPSCKNIARERLLHPAREMKMNLKGRIKVFVKNEKLHPQWDSNPQPLN